MHKKITFVSVILFLLFPLYVKAAELVCEYNYNPDSDVSVKIHAFYSSGSTLKYRFFSDDYQYKFIDALDEKDFKDKVCPNVWMYSLLHKDGTKQVQISKNWLGQSSSYILGKDVTATIGDEEEPTEGVEYDVKPRTTHVADDVPADCNALLTPDVQELVKNLLNIVKYAGPILVVVLTIFDLIKASLSGDAEELKKVSSRFIKRVVAAILLFFIPIFIGFIFDFFNITSSSCIMR